MDDHAGRGCGCEACAWKDDLIVELQHALRELQHELENERLAKLGWPIVVDATGRAA